MTNDTEISNDRAVFYAMRFDIRAGENVWTGRTGTREAILRDGSLIAPSPLGYCPHQRIDVNLLRIDGHL